MSISTTAEKYADYFQFIKMDNKDNESKVLNLKDDAPKELKELIFSFFNKNQGRDSSYKLTHLALCILSNMDEDAIEDEAQEQFYEQESPPYKSDLTSWLNESDYHLDYLTQALKEFEPTDGYQILAVAWQLSFLEIANTTLEFVLANNNKK